jgi:hypothetical protein
MLTATRIKTLRVVKTGAYTLIVAINAPHDASPGDHLGMSVTIKNTFVASINVACVALANGTRFIDSSGQNNWINPGTQKDFSGDLVTMPNGNLVIDAYSYFEDTNGVWQPDDHLQITIPPTQVGPNPPLLHVTNTPQSGQSLNFSFTGFQPNQPVQVYVQGGGGITVTANGSGNGNSSFIDNDPAGSYILIAQDNFGHTAQASFTVTAAPGWQRLTSQNVSVAVSQIAGWQKLASQNVQVAVSAVANWQKLATLNTPVAVAPAGGWQKLAVLNQNVAVQPLAGWEKLGVLNQNVAVQNTAGWQKLANGNVQVAVSQSKGWQQLQQSNVEVGISEIGGWQKLDTKDLATKAGFEIPAGYTLVLDQTTDAGKKYNGPAQRSVSSWHFLPAVFPGALWFTKTFFLNKLAGEVQKQGQQLLTMKLYEDGTDYFLVMETTNTATAYRALAPAIIAAIVIAALVLAIIITLAVTVHMVTDFLYKQPGTAIALGLILLGVAGAGVLGFAIYKGTSVRQAITGKKPAARQTTKALATASKP